MNKNYYVYILASKGNGTLYLGITNDLVKRFGSIKKIADVFTQKYEVTKLVYFESTPDPNAAITREKQLKKWKRNWKLRLIESKNPFWKDLYHDLV